MIIKFTSNNDYDFQCESVSLLKDAGRDLIKRASKQALFKDFFTKTAKDKNQELLHLIAVGAYEGTGFNRNGDAFSEADCIKNHHYFAKSDRAVHRHHKNKPKDPKYGNIKAAAYNKDMRRIELIVGLDRDKCADILNEQENTGNTNWSMASKQAEDECSWCHHRAKTDKDRCSHIPANIGEINKLGEMCGMFNPNPGWFEISYVKRPADRIGMSLGKVASDISRPMTSTDYLNMYGDLYIPDDILISKKAEDKRELLHKLAELEKHVEAISHTTPVTRKDKFIKEHGHKLKHTANIDDTSMDSLRKMEPSLVLKTLADHGVVLKIEDFMRYLFDNRAENKYIQGMKKHTQGIFNRLKNNKDGEVVNNEKYDPAIFGKSPDSLKQTVKNMHESHSLEDGPALRRLMIISISGNNDNRDELDKESEWSADDYIAESLAKEYCAYTISACDYIDKLGKLDDTFLTNVFLQNY